MRHTFAALPRYSGDERIAVVLTPSGQVQPVRHAATEIMAGLLGPTVTAAVGLSGSIDMWFDPQAAMSCRPVNPLAITVATCWTAIPTTIHGPAVIAGHTDSGTVTGLHADDLDALVRWCAAAVGPCDRRAA